jgi:flagellar biosynthesis chaperone FliJ
MRRIKTVIALLLVILLLAGCTSAFVYNRLDWLIPWYVDGYMDITRDQRQMLRQQLAPTLDWHREEELARYIDILDHIETGIEGSVDAAWVRARIDEMLDAAQRVEKSMLSVALEFGEDISDEQVQEFIDSLWEEQKEYEEEFTERSDEEYASDDYDNIAEFLQRFLGRLTPEQKSVLREASQSLQRFDQAWMEDRRQWLQNLEPLLAREDGWQEAVMDLYRARKQNRAPAYTESYEHNLAIISEAVAEVVGMMNERQKQHAADEIDGLRDKLNKLIEARREQAYQTYTKGLRVAG